MDGEEASPAHTTEAPYGRVTNSARFAMLHRVALDVLDRLHGEFQVERIEPYAQDEDFNQFARVPLARQSVALVSGDPGCAPLVVAFSSFPGLLVQVGSFYRTVFPNCGCDACDESAEGEGDRFRRLVHAVTSGHFRESVQMRGDGWLTRVWEWEWAGQQWREEQLESTHGSSVDVKPMLQWKPWINR